VHARVQERKRLEPVAQFDKIDYGGNEKKSKDGRGGFGRAQLRGHP